MYVFYVLSNAPYWNLVWNYINLLAYIVIKLLSIAATHEF